jgi:hypothetical protein
LDAGVVRRGSVRDGIDTEQPFRTVNAVKAQPELASFR